MLAFRLHAPPFGYGRASSRFRNLAMLRRAAFAAILLSATPVHAAETDSRFEFVLENLSAITPAAAPAPEGDAFCGEKFADWHNSDITIMMRTWSDTGRRIVAAELRGVATDLDIQTVPGSFMGFAKASELEAVDRIIFTVDAEGRNGSVEVLLKGDGAYNCVLSSQ